MITRCRFCDYHKDTPLSISILKVLADPATPSEDQALWMGRLFHTSSFKDWNGVKIHMGRMHKGDSFHGIWPACEFTKEEAKIIDSATK